ncbi:4-(cytidine 5'-diphospho)-2-C-methyl-D-erythritol kinase [Brucella sp. BE17]|uniref:4-(cytidine 5'-diphospho)-2-C-methyl-D-erythritol kinase n=1 Tax=Brucella sp. BE17 TaxID=3142977 RepID=UPI0031BBC253
MFAASLKNKPVSRLAPAKINLALHVTGRRDDGYHLLDMMVVFAAHGDHITIKASENDSFTVSGAFARTIPLDTTNLVLKARDVLRANFGRELPPVAIHLEKNLPIASGIGGGSSDAAATLLALAEFWQLEVGINTLAQIGLTLGADLPMCLHGTAFDTSLAVRGIGDVLAPVHLPSLPLLLVNDGTALSTPSVFSALKNRDNAPLASVPATDTATLCQWLASTRNDLLPAALSLAPQIALNMELLRENNALYAQMSGSGATCFGIFADDEKAARAATAIHARHPGWFVMQTRSNPVAQPAKPPV